MSSMKVQGGGQQLRVEKFAVVGHLHNPEEVAAFIESSFSMEPEVGGVLTPKECQEWIEAVIGIREFVAKQCDSVKANRGQGIDNVKKAMMGMLSAMDVRRNLSVLNDRTLDMIHIAQLAEVELFAHCATKVMYATVGKPKYVQCSSFLCQPEAINVVAKQLLAKPPLSGFVCN